MSYNVLYTENFRKEAKRLAKKHVSLKKGSWVELADMMRETCQDSKS